MNTFRPGASSVPPRPARAALIAAAILLPVSAPVASQPIVRVPGMAPAASGASAPAGPPGPLVEFDPRSTPAAPCGKGLPPPGHVLPEVTPGAEGLTITVRQDRNRLCYVVDG